jgi:hypothetical protein
LKGERGERRGMLLTSGRGRLCALRRDGLRTDGEVDGR